MTTAIKRAWATKGKRQIALQVVSNMLSLCSDPAAGKWRAARGRRIRLRTFGQYRIVREGTLTQPAGATFMPVSDRSEHLTSARFVRPSGVKLTFADGLTASRTFAELGIEPDELRLAETRVSLSGSALEVQTKSGQIVSIDSASIRCLVDPAYAERLETATAKLDIPSARLDELAGKYRPPQSWYGSADEKPW